MKISFVIIEYHSMNDIIKCTKMIYEQLKNCSYEIIVSSNSQYTESEQNTIIQNNGDLKKWVFNPINGGFAYAMNKGLEISSGDILVIMNPDVLLIEGIPEMIKFFEANPTVGAIAPKIIDDNGCVQDSYRNYLTLSSFVCRHLKRFSHKKEIVFENEFDNSLIQTVDWVIGAFIMVKRQVYEKTNGLDSNYFLYCEDMDWCTRIREIGYEIVYYPKAIINYTGSRSARKSLKYAIIFMKSLNRYWRKFGYFNIKIKQEKKIYS